MIMLRKPLAPIEDDTEEAPWMVMGMPQFEAVNRFYDSLQNEMRSRRRSLLVAAMLPIRYRPLPGGRIEQLAPDILVAPVPVYSRSSYDMDREGVAPAFVLEVVSPESRSRDLKIKPERYERMGVREYALFAPVTAEGAYLLEPPLQGYRLDPSSNEYIHWEGDAEGRLYSEVMDLWLTVRAGVLRAQRPDGTFVPTREELEAEIARLRAELERRAD
jgi:hypothetical protein